MVKLYWRVKRDGRWTWTPATIDAWSPVSIMLTKDNQKDIDGTLLFPEDEEE